MRLSATAMITLVLGTAVLALAGDLESRRESALTLLLTTDEFASPFVDAAGMPSRQAIAFPILFRSEDPEPLFRQLVAEAKPAGQLYGLCGLFLHSRRDYRAVVGHFAEDRREVQTHRECIDPEAKQPDEWVKLTPFAKSLPAMFRSRLPTHDACGNELLVRVSEDRLVVIGIGPNQMADSTDDSPEFDSVDDIVLIVGDRVRNGPLLPREKQQRAVADVRAIGVAVETFSIDNNLYPQQAGHLDTVALIQPALEPIYIRLLPTHDPWGNPFLYWSNQTSYVIISTGADGLLDDNGRDVMPDQIPTIGRFSDLNTDIVFADGPFSQWPELDER